ncbi:MAG: NAD(P)/FAD-dependent oxidoreductase [Candidatus Kapaibacteriota bacterium]
MITPVNAPVNAPVTVELALSPDEAANTASVERAACRAAGISHAQLQSLRLVRRSIDARGRYPIVRMLVALNETTNETTHETTHETTPAIPPQPPTSPTSQASQPRKHVIIVGSGPAGYFAALELVQHGARVTVLERGRDVRARRRDLRALMQQSIVDPDSNYCFGEGGAGTYSDGKLYTRSSKRGNIRGILETLVAHGATPDILVDAHPHIGSNKLWQVVQNIRESIERLGGEVRFGARVVDVVLNQRGGRPTSIHGVVLADGSEVLGDAVILATGHSARDIYELCAARNIAIEAKSFALGVRVEHPQPLIDEMQYHHTPRNPHLPAASYSLTCQVADRGVYSFCMCPGGLIVPAATAPGEIVVNGMSMSRRDSPFANSGMVVEVTPEHYSPDDPLSALRFQQEVEQRTFAHSGHGTQEAPAQRLVDFIDGRSSTTIPKTSYIPGHVATNLHDILPAAISERLRRGLLVFGKQMRGYVTNEAVLVGVESRTSSPVRIPRDRTTYQHVHVTNLYPCGEGAGYAGGIVSAAMDGVNVAKVIVTALAIG